MNIFARQIEAPALKGGYLIHADIPWKFITSTFLLFRRWSQGQQWSPQSKWQTSHSTHYIGCKVSAMNRSQFASMSGCYSLVCIRSIWYVYLLARRYIRMYCWNCFVYMDVFRISSTQAIRFTHVSRYLLVCCFPFTV